LNDFGSVSLNILIKHSQQLFHDQFNFEMFYSVALL